MPFETVVAEVDGDAVGRLTLNRPEKLNALTSAMLREISACLAAWAHDPGVGAVIITGAGRAFSAAFDVEEFASAGLQEEVLASSTAYQRDVWALPKPTIAAVNGLAAGDFETCMAEEHDRAYRELVLSSPRWRKKAP